MSPALSLFDQLLSREGPHPFSVLVLSDRSEALSRLALLLRRPPCDGSPVVVGASSVEDAARHAETAPVDVSFFDAALGEDELLRWLSLSRSLSGSPPVILLASPESEQLTVRGLLHGACDFLFEASLSEELLMRSMHYSVERQRIEREGGEAAAAGRRFFDRCSAGAFRLSPAGEVLECNDAFARILGFRERRQALSGGELKLFVAGEEESHGSSWMLDLVDIGGQRVCLRRADGGPVWVLLQLYRVVGKSGELIEGSLIDLTQAESLRHRLLAREVELRALLGAIEEGALFADLEGRVQECNEAFEMLVGHPASELIGRLMGEPPLQARRAGEDHSARPLVEPEQLEIGASVTRPALLRCRDGSRREFPLEMRLMALGPSLEERRLLVLVRDSRPNGIHGARADRRLEVLGRLAGGLVHDLNNMLASVLGYADLLLLQIGEEDREAAHTAREVRTAAMRTRALLDQALTLARERTEPGETCDLGAVVRELLAVLEPLLGAGLDLEASFPSRPLPIRMERPLLERVITNLVLNARDAMPAGGILSLTVDRLESAIPLVAGAGAGHALLTVRDSGIGMDRATRERIFEPFFTTKPAGEGTGLGLATVAEIVRRSQGTVEVESAPGEGTTVRVRLPLVGTPYGG